MGIYRYFCRALCFPMKRLYLKLFIPAMLLLCAHAVSAQHKIGVQPAVITKYNLTEKFFLNQYFEYCHDFTNRTMNYWIAKPLGCGYKFNNWFSMDFGYYYFQFLNNGMHRPELSLIFTLRENNLQFQFQKRAVMDKMTDSGYYDWYHRSHFTISYDIPNTRFTPLATFEFYLKNGLKMARFHGGTHVRLTDMSSLSLQIFHILNPGSEFQEFYLFMAYMFNLPHKKK